MIVHFFLNHHLVPCEELWKNFVEENTGIFFLMQQYYISRPTLPVFQAAWNEMTWEGTIIVKEKRKSKGGKSKQVRKIDCCHVKNEQLKLVKKQSRNQRKKVPWRKMWSLQLFSVFNWESIVNFFFSICSWDHFIETLHITFTEMQFFSFK